MEIGWDWRTTRVRFPTLVSDDPLICAVWAGDLTGNGARTSTL